MFHTMREILFKLPDSAVVYSGHDYGEVSFDTLGNQKKVNPFLYLTNYKEFAEEVKNLWFSNAPRIGVFLWNLRLPVFAQADQFSGK